uniref:Uncharacterized protein n=1 Tax=Knipowitschia caucasica TaxID=637954 RepID=A0AAV2M5U9_KNICA
MTRTDEETASGNLTDRQLLLQCQPSAAVRSTAAASAIAGAENGGQKQHEFNIYVKTSLDSILQKNTVHFYWTVDNSLPELNYLERKL